MVKIHHKSEDDFLLLVQLPRCMWLQHGKTLEIPFQVHECRRHRKSNLLYALLAAKAYHSAGFSTGT